MKKLIPPKRLTRYLLAATLLTGLFIYGCKKDHALTSGSAAPDETAADMKLWLTKQNKDSLAIKAAGQLLSQAQWDLAHTVIADSSSYEIVLLKSTSSVSFDDPAKTQQRYLVIQKKNGSIVNSNVYELFGNKDEIETKANDVIAGFTKKNITGFTGNVVLYSWDNRVSKSRTYVNGISNTYSILQPKPADKKVVQTLKKVNQDCTDWYWCTYVDDVLISEEYLFTTCSDDNGNCFPASIRNGKGVLTVKTNCGGGGGGGNPPEQLPSTLDSIKRVIQTCNDLSESDKNEIYAQMQFFEGKNCLTKSMFLNYVSTGKTFSMCIDADLSASGNFNPSTKAITFKSALFINTQTMGEELFHAYQDTQYSNFGSYTANNGYVNIEFEQALWRDIQDGSTNAFAFHDTNDDADYKGWIATITNNNTTYPKSNSELNGRYDEFLQKFSASHHFGSPISMNPTAMFNNFTSFGCK